MSQPSSNPERRRTRRQPSKNSTKISCHKGTWGLGPNLARKFLDVSTDGLRLVVASPLDTRQEVTLNLEGLWQPRPIKIDGRVRWCAALADGTYCIGVHFQKTLSYSQVQVFAATSCW